MATNAGSVGGGNGGQTDMDRGQSYAFPYSKTQRKTGKVANGGSTANPNDKPGLSRPMGK
jgi:hypothetical protein